MAGGRMASSYLSASSSPSSRGLVEEGIGINGAGRREYGKKMGGKKFARRITCCTPRSIPAPSLSLSLTLNLSLSTCLSLTPPSSPPPPCSPLPPLFFCCLAGDKDKLETINHDDQVNDPISEQNVAVGSRKSIEARK